MEVANLIVNIFTAIGTIGAVIVSLYLASKKEKPKIKTIINCMTIGNKDFFSICILNNDVSKTYSIKEIGYANKNLNRWIRVELSKLQCEKRDYSQTENGRYKCIDCYLNEKFEYGQELYIIFLPKQVEEIISSNNKKKVKIAIIFLGEYKIWVTVSKEYLKQFV